MIPFLPSQFIFMKAPANFNRDDAFVGILPFSIRNKQELLKELATTLGFPPYFGFNWDALAECLRDFAWIEQKKVAIIHCELPKMSKNELKIYLEILRDTTTDWGLNNTHCLEIVFAQSDEESVRSILRD